MDVARWAPAECSVSCSTGQLVAVMARVSSLSHSIIIGLLSQSVNDKDEDGNDDELG